MANIVAIVGRPNVGKSTFFNRLTEKKEAIVDPTSGVTRDRHYGKAEWIGHEFSVIDTGGYVSGSDDIFEGEIRRQVELAIDEADTVLFLVDAMGGVTDLDDAIAKMLRGAKKPVFLVANKVDTGDKQYLASEFYSLGLGEVYTMSSANGSGTGDLLDKVVESFTKPTNETEDNLPKFAIVGKPNVGKSSFVNALLGREQNIVTPIAGTTRDPINSPYSAFGYEVLLLDTAGIRKRGKVHENIEFYSVLRSIRAIEDSHVCLLLIDAEDGISQQDLHIYSLIVKNGKGVVILVNKWDLIEKDGRTADIWEKDLKEKLAPFNDVPILFVSVHEKQRLLKGMEMAVQVYKKRSRKIPTSELNDVLLKHIENTPPPTHKHQYVKIKYITQLPTGVPSFAFFCNHPTYIKESYKRFLENRIRESWDYSGVPIRLYFRKK
jgi:GTP-binding protein